MHEELYIKEKTACLPILFALGILLLPFSMLTIVIEDGKTVFGFYFDVVILTASVLMSLPFFFKGRKRMNLLRLPFIAVLTLEFFRFGTVSLFNREIRFDFYIASVFMMLAALGYTFLICFIAEGKIRSRKGLFVWSGAMLLLGISSILFGFVPFLAYSEKVKGIPYYGISRIIQFLIFNLYAFVIALALQNDKVKAERKLEKEYKRKKKQEKQS